MPTYRRAWRLGGACFFTVNLLERHGNDLLIRHVDVLGGRLPRNLGG